jgi:drug/metabolite transporter (DMT)-like permease
MELASKLAPLNYTRILYSFIFDLFIFHAQIETWSIIGIILILIGCYNVI